MVSETVTYLLAKGEKSTRTSSTKTQQISNNTYLPLVVMRITRKGLWQSTHTFVCPTSEETPPTSDDH